MNFPESLRVEKNRSRNAGIKKLKKSLSVIGRFICLAVGAIAVFAALQIFYPDNAELKLPYSIFAILVGILGLAWLLSVSKNLFLLLVYFSGVFVYVQFVKWAFKGNGSDLPEWRWVLLSLFYGIFLWVAHNVGQYRQEVSH